MSPELPAKKYRVEFLVKAKDWDGVIRLFADELDIHEKRDSGDRQVGGFYFVTVQLPEGKLTNQFYSSIKKSRNIAIVTDEVSHQNGKKVLEEISRVETCLRRLLLHIPDLVENYFDLFSISTSKNARNRASSREVISATDFDPITSHITLEDVLKIFEDDFSWLNHPPTTDDLIFLIEHSNDLVDLKKRIKGKKKSVTIWAVISKYVLEKPVAWSEVRTDLHKLKELRNAAAHFRTVQNYDVEKTKVLASKVMQNISKQRVRSASEEIALSEFIRSTNETLKKLTDTINDSLKPQVDAFIRSYNDSIVQSARNAVQVWDSALVKAALESRLKLLNNVNLSPPKKSEKND